MIPRDLQKSTCVSDIAIQIWTHDLVNTMQAAW